MRDLGDRSGALLFVDASQSVGALPLDVVDLGMGDIGFAAVHRHNQDLADYMHRSLTEAGVPFLDHGPDHLSTVFSLAPDIDDLTGRMTDGAPLIR